MSTARERQQQEPTSSSQSALRALLRAGEQQISARIVEAARHSIALIVPRGSRIVVGDVVSLEVLEDESVLEDLIVEAVCDTQRFRRASDTEAFGHGLALQDAPALWIRCSAESPAARAALWTFATNREPRPEDRAPTSRDRAGLPVRGHDTEEARLERVRHLRERTGKALETLEHTRLVPERLRNNIENLIGGVEVPVGAAGPLWFNGADARGSIFLPMATTEGALVASATRGALAITLAGGVKTRVLSQAMQRVPGFVFGNVDQACEFVRWVQDFESEIRARVREVSRHARLSKLEPVVLGRTVHVRFVYETGDAAGQNMTTSCTWHACQWILEHIRHLPRLSLEHFFVEAGMSTDKKASFASLVSGRGMRVTAECFLDRSTLRRVLKVTPEEFLRNHHTGVTAALQAGMVGYNINVANIIAAVFTACGQDIACVHESSFGMLQVEPWGDGLYASMLLPSLIVGTVGGGTQLPQQREYLELMDCAGAGRVTRLAEIIAGYCLALDLSTISAIMSGHFATAHERLGRNRPVQYLRENDLDAGFFERALSERAGEPVRVSAVAKKAQSVGSSIVTDLTASRNTGKLVGLFARELQVERTAGAARAEEVIVKVKPLDREVLTVFHTMASAAGTDIARAARRHEALLGFTGCHRRELAVYRQTDPRFTRHVPRVHGIVEDPTREAYALILERLEGLALMDAADQPGAFAPQHIEAAISGIAAVHGVWLGREAELCATEWLGPVADAAGMERASELWSGLADLAEREFPEWINQADLTHWRAIIADVPSFWREIELLPRTLVHNDFSPRNFGLRQELGAFRLCAYDWELATLHLPQRDLAELLAFTLSGPFKRRDVERYIELHRQELERASSVRLDRSDWERGFVLALRDLLIRRMALYVMGHTCRDYRFVPRVFRTLMRLLDQFDDELSVRRSRPSSDSFPIPVV